MSDPDAGRCPICREPNDCGLTAGKTTCWCFGACISAAALERVPAADSNRACICQACAAAAATSSPAPRPADL